MLRFSSGQCLQVLSATHALVGSAVYARALADIADNAVVNPIPVRGDRATAFWYMSLSPALWLSGRLLRSAEASGDLRAQRAAGAVLTATGLVGASAMPASGFWAVLAVGARVSWRSRRAT